MSSTNLTEQQTKTSPDPATLRLFEFVLDGRVVGAIDDGHVRALAVRCDESAAELERKGDHEAAGWDRERAERLHIALAWFTNRRKTFPIPLSDPALFTASSEGQAFIASDRLSLRAGTAGLMAASAWIDRWVKQAPPRVHQPVLLMLAGHDRIVDNDKTRAFVERLASRERTVIEYPEAHHTLEFEPDPRKYVEDLARWLDKVLAPQTQSSALSAADG